MKVILADGFFAINERSPSESAFGVSAGYSVGVFKKTDNIRHFNKPKETIHVVVKKGTADVPAVIEAVEVKVPVLEKNEVVITTDVANPNTIFTLMLMDGRELPDGIDLASDSGLNPRSRSIHFDRESPAFFYRVGLKQVLEDMGLPLVSNRPVDITDIVEAVMDMGAQEVIAVGRKEIAKISHDEYFREQKGIVGLWVVGADKPSSFARIYQDGMMISVIYLEGKKQIVVSTDPKTNYDFGGRDAGKIRLDVETAGIKFAGSAHSSGSAKGIEYTEEDAKRVFEEIAQDPEKYIVIPAKKRGGGGVD